MAIERRGDLFYELMIRGVWDPQQGTLGTIATYQLQTGTALVDTDTNTLAAPYAPNPAIDLTREQAEFYLGEKAAIFIEQIGTLQRDLAALAAEHESQVAALTGKHERELAALTEERNGLRRALDFEIAEGVRLQAAQAARLAAVPASEMAEHHDL